MSFRTWLSILTLLLVCVIVYLSREQLLQAWQLLGRVNLWVLILLIPMQLLAYYAAGEIVFSYLRAKKSITSIKPFDLARISLEMNFVNHVLPSGGVSGISYTAWRLKQYDVSAGKATMAQMVRYAMQIVAFVILLAISVLMVTIDGGVNRWVILISSTLVSVLLIVMLLGIYLFSSASRISKVSSWLVKYVNPFVSKVSFKKVSHLINRERLDVFMNDMHTDYLELKEDRRILLRPLLWAIAFTLFDALTFWITFWALGMPVNPAPILIAYGVATFVGIVVVTPGGAGFYEVIMAAFLAMAGINNGAAIAGIVLTRMVVLVVAIGFGYMFYQHAIVKYGKDKPTNF